MKQTGGNLHLGYFKWELQLEGLHKVNSESIKWKGTWVRTGALKIWTGSLQGRSSFPPINLNTLPILICLHLNKNYQKSKNKVRNEIRETYVEVSPTKLRFPSSGIWWSAICTIPSKVKLFLSKPELLFRASSHSFHC